MRTASLLSFALLAACEAPPSVEAPDGFDTPWPGADAGEVDWGRLGPPGGDALPVELKLTVQLLANVDGEPDPGGDFADPGSRGAPTLLVTRLNDSPGSDDFRQELTHLKVFVGWDVGPQATCPGRFGGCVDLVSDGRIRYSLDLDQEQLYRYTTRAAYLELDLPDTMDLGRVFYLQAVGRRHDGSFVASKIVRTHSASLERAPVTVNHDFPGAGPVDVFHEGSWLGRLEEPPRGGGAVTAGVPWIQASEGDSFEVRPVDGTFADAVGTLPGLPGEDMPWELSLRPEVVWALDGGQEGAPGLSVAEGWSDAGMSERLGASDPFLGRVPSAWVSGTTRAFSTTFVYQTPEQGGAYCSDFEYADGGVEPAALVLEIDAASEDHRLQLRHCLEGEDHGAFPVPPAPAGTTTTWNTAGTPLTSHRMSDDALRAIFRTGDQLTSVAPLPRLSLVQIHNTNLVVDLRTEGGEILLDDIGHKDLASVDVPYDFDERVVVTNGDGSQVLIPAFDPGDQAAGTDDLIVVHTVPGETGPQLTLFPFEPLEPGDDHRFDLLMAQAHDDEETRVIGVRDPDNFNSILSVLGEVPEGTPYPGGLRHPVTADEICMSTAKWYDQHQLYLADYQMCWEASDYPRHEVQLIFRSDGLRDSFRVGQTGGQLHVIPNESAVLNHI